MRAVVFDMDGVLLDSEPHYCRKREEFLAGFGITLTREQSDRFVGQRFAVAFREVCSDLPPALFEKVLAAFVPWEIDHRAHFRPDAPDTMRRLRAMGLRIGIASNSVPEKIANTIRDCGLEGLVDAWSSGAQVARCKPAPDLYLDVCAKLEVSPQDCAAVEDSDYGLEAADAAGCRVICLVDRRFAFRQEKADVWIKSLAELPAAVESLMEERAGSGI